MGDEIRDTMEEARRAHDSPEAKMITDLGEAFSKSISRVQEAAKDAKTSVQDVRKELVSEIETLRTESLAAMQEIADRQEILSKRQAIAIPSVTPAEKCAKMLDAIPEKKRHLVQFAEQTMGAGRHPAEDSLTVEEKGLFKDPIFKTATALWFANSAKLQLPGKFKEQTRLREDFEKLEAAFDDAFGKATMQETTDALGGYTVPSPVAAEVLRLIEDNGVLRPRVRKIPMTSKTLDVPAKNSAITAYIGKESATLTEGMGAAPFASKQLIAKRFHGRATMSIELLEDSIIGLMPYIQTTLAEEIARLEDEQGFEGAGGGGTNFTGMISDTGVNEEETIATNGTDITYQHLTSTVFAARERASRNGAVWFMSPEQFGRILGMVDSNGQPIVKLGTVPGAIQMTILGFPVEPASSISASITRGSTGNTSNVYFGPPSAVMFGDRAGLRWDVSDAPNWGSYQMDARLVKRTGIVIGVPAALTKLVGGTVA